MQQQDGASGSGAQGAVAPSGVLVLQRDSKRVAIALPASLDLALSAASKHFPLLLRPLHLTRNLPELGGDVEITESVWSTGWIQGHSILTLDVHGSDKEIEIKDEEEEEIRPEVRRRVKSEDTPNVKVEGSVGDMSRVKTEHSRSASEHGVPRSATADNRWTFQQSQASLPSPPASRGCRSLSPPALPSLLPSMVPPEEVHVKLVFPHPSELPDMYVSLKATHQMIFLLFHVAHRYEADPATCFFDLRLYHDGVRLSEETAGELVDYDEVGTPQNPLVLDVGAEIGGPDGIEDYERCLRTGEPMPQYRDKILRILKPLPTDPYLPSPPTSLVYF